MGSTALNVVPPLGFQGLGVRFAIQCLQSRPLILGNTPFHSERANIRSKGRTRQLMKHDLTEVARCLLLHFLWEMDRSCCIAHAALELPKRKANDAMQHVRFDLSNHPRKKGKGLGFPSSFPSFSLPHGLVVWARWFGVTRILVFQPPSLKKREEDQTTKTTKHLCRNSYLLTRMLRSRIPLLPRLRRLGDAVPWIWPSEAH